MFFVLSWAWVKEKLWGRHEGLRFKSYHLSYSIYKHNAKDIADPSSLQNMCHIWTSRWALLTVESLWLSGRALEHGIWRCEVWFLMVTLSNAHDKTKNIFFLFLTKLKTYPLSYSIYNFIDPHFWKISDILALAFHYMLWPDYLLDEWHWESQNKRGIDVTDTQNWIFGGVNPADFIWCTRLSTLRN